MVQTSVAVTPRVAEVLEVVVWVIALPKPRDLSLVPERRSLNQGSGDLDLPIGETWDGRYPYLSRLLPGPIRRNKVVINTLLFSS